MMALVEERVAQPIVGTRVRQLAAAVAMVLVAGVATAAGISSAAPSHAARAATALRQAQRFAVRARTVRFSSKAQYDVAPGSNGFSGTVLTVRLDGDGSVAFPDRYRLLEHNQDRAAETVVIGSAVYHREGTDATALLARKWIDVNALTKAAANGGGSALGGTIPEIVRPSALLEMVRNAREARFVRHAGKITTIHARLGSGAYSVDGKVLDTTALELRVHNGGEIAAMVVRFQADVVRGAMTYTFRRWARPVSIEAPAGAQIDTTPTVDEEGIASFHDVSLVAPRSIPVGWILDGAALLASTETVEGCRQVELDFADPTTPDHSGSLTLFEFPVACAKGQAPNGSRPFTAGTAQGWVVDDNGDLSAQLVIGGMILQAETDLSPGDLAAVLRNLVPLDLAHPPIANLPAGGGTRS